VVLAGEHGERSEPRAAGRGGEAAALMIVERLVTDRKPGRKPGSHWSGGVRRKPSWRAARHGDA
jgi:hypothetical protein